MPLPRDVRPGDSGTRATAVSGGLDDSRPLVLVVDDDQSTRSYLAQLLEAEGYAALTVADGPTALTAASRLRPDLITMDILMPDMDGREVIRQLRADRALRRIPILVVTILQEREAAGGDAALGKPIDEARLLAAIGGLLGKARPAREYLALSDDGQRPMDAAEGLHDVEHLSMEDIRVRLDQGFQGTVLLPASAARDMDLPGLFSRPGVRVLILPDTQS